jgi:Uma2 family endonuclease
MSTSPLTDSVNVQSDSLVSAIKRNPMIEDFHFADGLPTAEELPFSDDVPVDSELQELVSGLLKIILLDVWRERTGWLLGVDMALYYDQSRSAVAPDAFLCLGVKDEPGDELRLSYLLWQERVLPLFALEIVSKSPGREGAEKMDIYEKIGILYYVVYAPRLQRKSKFQLYKLVAGEYVLQSDGREPYWMPEIGLGIGSAVGDYRNRRQEWLYWFNQDGQRYLNPIERANEEAAARALAEQTAANEAVGRAFAQQQAASEAAARVLAEQTAATEAAERAVAEQKAMRLREQLRQLGIEPEA